MRKKYGVIFAVFGLFISFFYMEVWGADWKLYATNQSYTFFYDVESITHPTKDIVRVWLKFIASPQGVRGVEAKYGKQYKDFGYIITLKEINCAEKMSQHLEEYHYSNQGKILGTFKELKWRYFVPGSSDEILYKAVCKSTQPKEAPDVVPAKSKVKRPVIGSDSKEVFKGFLEKDELRASSAYIEVEAQVSKTRCSGHAMATYGTDVQTCKGTRGIAELKCGDGRIISGEFVCLECGKGTGSGLDQIGNRFIFAFGMTEPEAIKYFVEELKIASKEPDSSLAYKPQETRKEKGFSTGTGFFVSTDGYLVTNYHVIEDSKKVLVITADKKTVLEAEIIETDPANDVALLKIKATTKPLPFSDQTNLSKGEDVFTLGYPLIMIQGQQQKATFGRINSLTGITDDIRFMQIDVPIQHGNSGGPLINMNGQVVGVITAILDQLATLKASGTLPQNVNYALKFDYVIPLLRYHFKDMLPKPPTMKGTQAVKDLIKIAEPSVVLIIAE